MKIAFSYKRVSSKEQKEKENSIPEQDRRIKQFAKDNDIMITKEFEDSNSAFHDELRSDFDTMIETALKERPDYIILDDSSRFARTRQVAIDTKSKLRSYGINILYASEPNVDNSTVAGFWLESIQEIKNEATSREISFNTKRGMTGNIQHRDIETGWCYKNGGKPPYGYKRTILHRGFDKRGKPSYKTIWELDETTFSIARKIIVDMYTEKEMSYTMIRDYLNDHKIKSPSNNLWSTSTIVSMLTSDRLEQYTGTAIWNKANNNVIGVKYNKKDKWVICENAHPAIITKEEYQKAMERKSKTSNNTHKFNINSDYLLSGLNFEEQFLFTCADCGGHIIGCSTGKKHIKKYTCSTNNHKGSCGCSNNWKIEKEWLENIIINTLENNYFTNKKIEACIDTVYKDVCNIKSIYSNELKNIEIEIKTTNGQIQNLLNSIKNGVNPELVVNDINGLKELLDKLNLRKTNIINAMENEPQIKRKDIENYFYNFQKLFSSSTLEERKELITTFIENITLNKKEHQIEITPYSIGVRGLGAGSGNRTRVISLEG